MSEIIIASVILAGTYTLWKVINSRYRMKEAELNRRFLREVYEKIRLQDSPPLDPPPLG